MQAKFHLDIHLENTLFEAESDLDIYKDFSVKDVLHVFKNKGGSFIRLQPGFSNKLKLNQDDIVYPACSLGFCRSQTLWVLLKEFKDLITLMPPHATRYGFDPYNDQINWHRSRAESNLDEFNLWAGFDKCTRIGFDEFSDLRCETHIPKNQLDSIRDFYNLHYFGPHSTSKRRVYIAFDKNTHVIIHRLNETNVSLENVTVYHFPFGDKVTHPKPEWQTFSRGADAYHHFSLMLNELIDFSVEESS